MTTDSSLDAFPTKSVGYFPGYSLPDFSPSKTSGRFQSSGFPGHVSLVTSPFLANSKVPTVPHLLESETNVKNQKDNSTKKRVVINIINGGNANTSSWLRFGGLSDPSRPLPDPSQTPPNLPAVDFGSIFDQFSTARASKNKQNRWFRSAA